MPSSWVDTTLGAVAHFFSGGTPSKSNLSYWCGRIPWLSAKDMRTFRISDTEDHVSEAAIGSGTRLMPPGTVFLLVRGMTLHRDVPICLAKVAMSFNQDVKAIRPSGSELLPEYLPYLLLGAKPVLQNMVDSAGHGTGRLNSDELRALAVSLPPLDQQRAISQFFCCIDDRLDNLASSASILEATAQAIFKSWFVDFDPVKTKAEGREPEGMDAATAALFPSEFEVSALGSIPKGWSVATVGQIAHVVDCLHSKKPDRLPVGKTLLQLSNICDNGLLDLSDRYCISDDDYRKWISRLEASPGDCVITNVGRVGAVSQIPEGCKAALGRNMTAIRCRIDLPFRTFLIQLLISPMFREEINLKTDSGTILDSLNVRNIPALRFVRPTDAIAEAFERVCRPLRAKMELALASSQTLASLRDALLPKLMSGQIRVPEAEALVSA